MLARISENKINVKAMTGLGIVLFFLLGVVLFAGSSAHAQVTEGVGVSLEIGGAPPPPPPPGGGGGGTPTTGAVTMEGKAYPNAFMTILQDGAVAQTFLANSDGTFSGTVTGITPGIHSFGIYAEDAQGRDSPTLSLSLNITAGTITTVKNLFMPPTIEAPPQAESGSVTVLLGTTFPNANIFLYIEPGGSVKETKADAQGNWQYILSTSGLGKGEYTVRAKAITDMGEQSEFSSTVSFEIVTELPEPPEPPVPPGPPTPPGPPDGRDGVSCPNGDLNRDGVVDITDISIWVYYLDTDDSCADQNNDGIVDVFDLSIIVFYWK